MTLCCLLLPRAPVFAMCTCCIFRLQCAACNVRRTTKRRLLSVEFSKEEAWWKSKKPFGLLGDYCHALQGQMP